MNIIRNFLSDTPQGGPGVRAHRAKRSTLFFLLLIAIIGALGCVVAAAALPTSSVEAPVRSAIWRAGVVLLTGLAALTAGSTVGFLFGIPKTPSESPPATSKNRTVVDAPDASASNIILSSQYVYRINTNLEQISDWLTKIIVGSALIELRKLSELLNSLNIYVATSLGAPQGASLVGAVVIFFSAEGFLFGYINTRWYLAAAFAQAESLIGNSEQHTNQTEQTDSR